MSEVVVACAECYRSGRGVQKPEAHPFAMEDGMTGTKFVCPLCARVVSVTYDFGELDLGVVKESVLNPDNDFEVFTEEPWRT